MFTTKRLAILLLTLAIFGTAACSDASGPSDDVSGPNHDTTCTENQGNGGRTCQ
jgi:hypothetical protein